MHASERRVLALDVDLNEIGSDGFNTCPGDPRDRFDLGLDARRRRCLREFRQLDGDDGDTAGQQLERCYLNLLLYYP